MCTAWSIRLTRTRTCSSFRHKNPPPPLRPSLRGWCHAVLLRGVDDRPVVLRAAGPRRRGGRVRLDDGARQHLLPRARRQPVPVHSRRQPRVPRGQALPRAVLAHPRARGGDRADPVRDVRAEAPRAPPGAGGQAGHLDGRADRQPARAGRRDQPVAGGLRGARRGLGHPRAAHGRGDRHPARARGRRLLLLPREDLRPAAGQDRPGAGHADPRPGRRSLRRGPAPGRAAGRRLAARRGRPGRTARPARPGTAAPPGPRTARSRCT
jgi:hypothetical protein